MPKKEEKITFEKALRSLEELTRALEGGELSLDESIQAYERGVQLKAICLEMLAEAEKRLEYLEQRENGEVVKKKATTRGGDVAGERLFE